VGFRLSSFAHMLGFAAKVKELGKVLYLKTKTAAQQLFIIFLLIILDTEFLFSLLLKAYFKTNNFATNTNP